jgi:hypothetical protein
MLCYVINVEAQDAQTLAAMHAAVKNFSGWARITSSCWAVMTDQPAKAVRDELAAILQPGDRLFVLRSGTEAAWRNVRCSNEWLKKNL